MSICKNKIWLIMGLTVIAVALALTLYYTKTIIPRQLPSVSAPPKPISSLPTQTNNNGNKTPSLSNTISQGSDLDNNGKAPSGVSSNASSWSTSSSGLITLENPIKNSDFLSGDVIYGIAASGPVSYRLIDNSVGQIAEGTIDVIGGKFSATITFKYYSSSGSLDIFNTTSTLKEINEIQVPINF